MTRPYIFRVSESLEIPEQYATDFITRCSSFFCHSVRLSSRRSLRKQE
ncbi:Uncharacterized protein dnm_082140 [Desulfonema magnum]|uniref:Uncharacterized protein n=1 Tax=Desulfonema magnum TaxID=45655 RepID=A0A975BV13_9BACT|nr:Uncharacterized protein dnm_082140 [Desulfonema magnum]